MSKLSWVSTTENVYEAGLDKGVFYPPSGSGVPWNGLVSVDENTNAEDPLPIFVDGVKVFDVPAPREFTATLSCYTYPDEFLEFDGYMEAAEGMYFGEQMPASFGLCYRTRIGSTKHYKLHLLYNMTATPGAVSRKTFANIPEPSLLSWKLQGAPMKTNGGRPTSHVVLDTRRIDKGVLRHIEEVLYGSDDNEPRLPSPNDLEFFFSDVNPVVVTLLAASGEYALWAPSFYMTVTDGVFEFTGPTFEDFGDGTFSVESEVTDPAIANVNLGG